MLICFKRYQIEVIVGESAKFYAFDRHWVLHGEHGLGLGLRTMAHGWLIGGKHMSGVIPALGLGGQ